VTSLLLMCEPGRTHKQPGAQVLSIVVPILVRAMGAPTAAARVGVCRALREVVEALDRDTLATQLPALMPAVQAALCDADAAVRDAAAEAFAVLFQGGAASMLEGMLPALLADLAEPQRAQQAIKGLRVILSVRPGLIDRLLPKLLALPLKQHRVEAAGPLMAEAPSKLAHSLAFALPRLLRLPPAQRDDDALRGACHAASVAAARAAADAHAVSEAARQLTQLLQAPQSRGAAAAVLRDWAPAATAEHFEIHKQALAAAALELLGEPVEGDADALPAVWAAAKAVLGTVAKEDLAGYVTAVRRSLQAAQDTARRNVEDSSDGAAVEIPGCATPPPPFFPSSAALG
jgi:HEAT repeat